MPELSVPAHALEQLQTTWPVAVPMVVSLIALFTPIVQYYVKKNDKAVDASMTREQRLMSEADARILQASKIDADVMTRLQAELVRVTGRMSDLEMERDKARSEKDAAWDRAHYWHRRAHDMRHIAVTATQTMMEAARQGGGVLPATPDLSLPNFLIDPLPT